MWIVTLITAVSLTMVSVACYAVGMDSCAVSYGVGAFVSFVLLYDEYKR